MVTLLITGCRKINDMQWIMSVVDQYLANNTDVTAFITGNAEGVDKLATEHILNTYKDIEKLPPIKPNYKIFGKRAPLYRNTTLVTKADKVLALWCGDEGGTWDTIKKARKMGKQVLVAKLWENNKTLWDFL